MAAANEAWSPALVVLLVPRVSAELEARRGVKTRGATEACRGVPRGVEARCGVHNTYGVWPRRFAISALAPLALGVVAGDKGGPWGEAAKGEAGMIPGVSASWTPVKAPAGTWIYWDLRRLWISFEAVAMDNVEYEMARCRESGLTQKISAMPQPGLRYSNKHLFRTL